MPWCSRHLVSDWPKLSPDRPRHRKHSPRAEGIPRRTMYCTKVRCYINHSGRLPASSFNRRFVACPSPPQHATSTSRRLRDQLRTRQQYERISWPRSSILAHDGVRRVAVRLSFERVRLESIHRRSSLLDHTSAFMYMY